jgi:hypothetical protein
MATPGAARAAEAVADAAAAADGASRSLLSREVDLAADATKRAGKAAKDVADAGAAFDRGVHGGLHQLSETIAAARLVGANLIMLPQGGAGSEGDQQ